MKRRAKPAKVDFRRLGLALFLLAAAAPAQQDPSAELLKIRRVHVEKLSGGETATQIRDMIIARLQRSGLFVLTEDPERADAYLRGSAEDLIYTDTHETREGVDARASISTGAPRSSSSRYGRGVYVSSGIGQDESSRAVERRHEAMAAVRLVNKHGDVIWSTVQESKGAKFQGASADVAEKVARQLVADYEKARKPRQSPKPSAPPDGEPPAQLKPN